MQLEILIAFFASSLLSSILFYILVDGFYWKPTRAVFAAPFALFIVPVACVIVLLWGMSRILFDGLERFLTPRRTRKA